MPGSALLPGVSCICPGLHVVRTAICWGACHLLTLVRCRKGKGLLAQLHTTSRVSGAVQSSRGAAGCSWPFAPVGPRLALTPVKHAESADFPSLRSWLWRLTRLLPGQVYKAQLDDGIKDVAVKFIRPGDCRSIKNFAAEVDICRACRDDYITGFIGAWFQDVCISTPFSCMMLALACHPAIWLVEILWQNVQDVSYRQYPSYPVSLARQLLHVRRTLYIWSRS